MWVARDKNGKLQVYKEKPVRVSIKTDKLNDEDKEFWDEEEVFDGYDKWIHPEDYFEIDRNLFPDLKWEDGPIEVKLVEVENKTKQDKDDVEKVCKNCQFYREVPACYDSKGFCKDWKLSTYIRNQMKKNKKK